ncbi:hypothetical protein BgiBS90_010978 [Biomphalaria glabrata]|nr:hypothetical protein BgiBS90_010978 [Biomphalaria glabrata]
MPMNIWGQPFKNLPKKAILVSEELAEVAHKLIPIYRRMSDESLLQEMAHSGTQNNESLSLNDMIWAICPKTSFMGLGRITGSVARAVSYFMLAPMN